MIKSIISFVLGDIMKLYIETIEESPQCMAFPYDD
jgi:hypothetical protein